MTQTEHPVTPATRDDRSPVTVPEDLSLGGKLGGLLFLLVFILLGVMVLGELVLKLFR
jgi:hypothetical protein